MHQNFIWFRQKYQVGCEETLTDSPRGPDFLPLTQQTIQVVAHESESMSFTDIPFPNPLS
jgi:hypothetical protein